MVTDDETALVCDLAESYGVYNYRSLSLRTVAQLVAGLGVNSRISKKVNGMPNAIDELLLAEIADRLGLLLHGLCGIDKPKSIVESLYGLKQDDDSKVMAFDDPSEFMRYRYNEWD